jgi:tetratricopeptide (TPR) repeat protein
LKALYYSPGATEAHLALSEIYTESNEYQEALVHLKAAHDNEPQNKSILQVYGEVLFLSEDNKNCLEVYERLTDLEPENQAIKERIEILKNRLGIFELPSQYDSIPFSDAITKEEMSALIGVKFKNYFTEPSRKPPIIIDISTSWASKYILSAATLDIMDVYSNHTFQPKKIITRAEMAEALIRLIDQLKKKGYRFLQQIPPERIHIADVSSDNFYYRPIVTMISYDIMSLSLGRKFNPDQAISGSVTIRLLDIIIALTK